MPKRKQYFAIPSDMFWAKTDRPDGDEGCWIWKGEVASTGYPIGYKESGGEERLAHRWSWRLANGPLPKGAPLKWTCENRLCVNPAHMYIAETPRGDRATTPRPASKTPRKKPAKGTVEVRERAERSTGSTRRMDSDIVAIPKKIKGRTDKPKAIGILNGSGGMAIGFEKAGFEVLGSLEADREYGRTFRLNRPDLFHAVSIGEWEELFPGISDDITLAFGHPPCQGVSGMNAQSGATNAKNDMLPLAAETGMRMGAHYVVLENIPRMLSLGRDHVDKVAALAPKYGYTLDIHRHFVGSYGVSQKRRRVLFVLTKKGHEIYWPTEPEIEPPSVWDLISDLHRVPVSDEPHGIVHYEGEPDTIWQQELRSPEGFTYNHYRDPLPERYEHIPIGKRWTEMPLEYMSDKERLKVTETKNFYNAAELVRADPGNVGRTVTGARNKMHPYQTRRLTVREIARLMGFPDNWHFALELNWQQVAAGVCPPVCEHFGKVIMAHLSGDPLPAAEGALF